MGPASSAALSVSSDPLRPARTLVRGRRRFSVAAAQIIKDTETEGRCSAKASGRRLPPFRGERLRSPAGRTGPFPAKVSALGELYAPAVFSYLFIFSVTVFT